VTLASCRLAELNRLVGRAIKRITSQGDVERLSRVYWFTIEFGVVRKMGEIKAYGTGLLSSAGELEAMRRAELRPLDLEAASRKDYEPTKYQPLLFCADSFEAMYEALYDYLLRWR
jgi:phenylalanine-4-hydroxylase